MTPKKPEILTVYTSISPKNGFFEIIFELGGNWREMKLIFVSLIFN
jgi:hypothetical protein